MEGEEPVIEAGPEVAPVAPPEEAAAAADPGLEIGDKVLVLGGSLNKTRGHLYGFDEDRLILLVSGSSDRVLKIPLVDGLPDPELGIQAIKVLRKAPVPGFVAMLDLKVGDFVETFAAEGEAAGTFEITEVNPEIDSATFKDEAGSETVVAFGFQQVPRDLGVEVVRVREPPAALPPPAEGEELPPLVGVGVDEEDLAGGEEAPSAGEAQAEGPGPQFAVLEEIEIPLVEEEREVSSEMKIFPDSFQVAEMRGQLFRMLPQAQQKNSLKLQELRRLVELMLIMRNEVVRYGITGEPRGLQQTSLTTLKELVDRPGVPLAKPVIQAIKALYPSHTKAHLQEDERDEAGPISETLTVDYLSDVLGRIRPWEELANTDTGEAVGGALPSFFQNMIRYYQSIQSPFELSRGGRSVQEDMEAFVNEAPDFDEKPVEAMQMWDPTISTRQIAYRTMRLLKERYGRFLTGDERIRIIEPAENPEVTSILIFPRKAVRDLGPIRSGSLAQDISLSMIPPRIMRDILLKLGEATEYPTADGILHIGVKGNLLGNVLLKDWLESQDLILTGPADVLAKLRGYGVEAIEWNQEQSKVIQGKVESHIAGLRIWLRRQREENKVSLGNLKFEPQPLLPAEQSERILARIKSEPLLQKYFEEIQKAMGDLANIDINYFSYILLKAPDLLLAALGQQPAIVARERQRKVREQFLARLEATYKAEKRKRERADPVAQKPCPHNQSLDDIEKVAKAREDEPRETTKQRLLLEFMTKYRSRTQDGWVWCNVCDQHLLCEHRHLQLQEFLKPREQDVIHKELLLKFSGGVFGGKFICKVCGQAIQDLEFDTNLEFDDEGRPMIGRSVIEEDRGQLVQDEIEGLLEAADKEEDEDAEVGTALMKSMIKVFKRLSGLVGINPAKEDYMAMVEKMTLYHSTLPSREAYARAKKPQDYDVYYSVRFVAAAAAILLINIQCKMPDYVIYYTSADCKGVFSGFPIDDTGDKQALLCMASAIASINDNEFPWNLTTLQTRSDLIKRRDGIVPFVENLCKEFLKQPAYQDAIQKKRAYRLKLYGTESVAGKADQIPDAFRPVPFVVSKEEAAAEGVVAAAAEPGTQAVAWIRSVHKIAHESASVSLNPDAIRTTTTCCLHNVNSPQEFWAKADLPPLEPRMAGQYPFRSSTLTAPFAPEKLSVLEGKTDPREFYKLFVVLCYKGDNKGLPHKLGFGLTCSECGLHFTSNPRIPLAVPGGSKEDEKKYKEDLTASATSLKANIEAQGVEINEDTFNDLLTTAHLKTAIVQEESLRIPRAENTFVRFAALEDAQPLPNWQLLLAGIQGALMDAAANGGGLTEIQISTASEEMIAAIVAREESIKQRLGEETFEMVSVLLARSPRECGEILQAYFLAPFQRLLTGLETTKWDILDTYELSAQTKSDILVRGIQPHVFPLNNGRPLEGLAKRKVRKFVEDLSALCQKVFPTLRPLLTPGGQIMVNYLKRAYVVGVLQRFLDPNVVPPGDEDLEEGVMPNLRVLYSSVALCLKRLTKTSRIPTEQEIREKLEARAELEKQEKFRKFERLTADEKKAYLMNQRLGTGEFAVGGTKVIRQYDEEYYDRERLERARGGILDYDTGFAADIAAIADGGYDVDQGWAED